RSAFRRTATPVCTRHRCLSRDDRVAGRTARIRSRRRDRQAACRSQPQSARGTLAHACCLPLWEDRKTGADRVSYLRRRPAGVRTPKQRAGDAAEDAACTHLVENGCRVLARNVRYREGELDVVAQDGPTLVFVEVRLRSRDTFGGAADSVDRFKR